LPFNADAINGDNLVNMKKNYSGDNSQHVLWCHSKNLLSHRIIWAMFWFNVVRSSIVINKFLTSLSDPN
jgi:hypothetical protein